MNHKLKEKTMESFSAVMPITIIVLILSVFPATMETGTISMFVVGAALLVVGMGLFQLGAEIAMTPLGEGIGVQLSKSKSIVTIIVITFVMGAVITIAEPDLQVLAGQVPSIPNMVLVMTVALGVGLFLVVAILRIMFKINLSKILFALYFIVFVLSAFTPKSFLSIAFDAGGVTTGPITVPFIMAIGVGIASIRSDKNATDDSFGLVALSSVGPILAVMILGIFYKTEGASYSAVEISSIITTRDVAVEFLHQLPHYAKEVLVSFLPIVAVYLIFQALTKRYQKRQQLRITVGIIYTYLGLVLFLCGVNVGFAPVGSLLGSQLAGASYKWILVPIGMLIGYFIVKAEPAIQVLNRQVADVTNGSISEEAMNNCLSIGVSVSVGLAMIRVLSGISIYWFLIPGYAIALILTRFVPKLFVGIAFDSGGVASGPMTSTFLLPLCIGACEALGGNVMMNAFGVVAMVAMTPLIAIQIMGVVYTLKERKNKEDEKEKPPIDENVNDVLVWEEEE